MVLSTSQHVALAFTAVLFTFVVLPRLFGVGGGPGAKESRFESRYGRKAAGPGSGRGQPLHGPGSAQTSENLQQMKKLMEQELKGDKYKSNSSKGYVFTLMPLYAIGVGVFAAYKFLKIKSADDQAQKDKCNKGAKKSVEAEKQLNELEQRLAQTEKMLNSILTQLDPLTNCVKSVAQDQKNEIMSQLQTIRHLMKKRGMDCPPLTISEGSCERNLDDLIESLGASDTSKEEKEEKEEEKEENTTITTSDAADSGKNHQKTQEEETVMEEEEIHEEEIQEEEQEVMEEEVMEEEVLEEEVMPSLEDSESNIDETSSSVLRRRNRNQ